MSARIHLLKLCVGADSVEDLAEWQAARVAEAEAAGQPPRTAHVTRMWPKRGDELVAGGSLYWVIRGQVLCRQRILALEPHRGQDGIPRCAVVLEPVIHRTRPQPRRAFQGWRYLRPEDAPADLAQGGSTGAPDLPPQLEAKLAELGVL